MGEYAKTPVALWAVRLGEPNPPPGESPREWILVTTVPVLQVTEAQVRADL